MSRLDVENLHLTYPGRPAVQALAGLDMHVGAGQVAAVLGPSGCGKTSLLRVLAGLTRPDSGSVLIGGEVVEGPGVHVAPQRRRVGLVPQEGALFPHLSVAGNIGFGLRGRSRAERRARVQEMLDVVGLVGLGERGPEELSGGQQQRVALARALAPEPDLVLLDEPFSALDTGLRAAVRSEVMATLRASGATSVLVTHDQVEALGVADVVAVMAGGTVVQQDAPAALYEAPSTPWVGTFLGDANLLDGTVGSRPDDPTGWASTSVGPVPLAVTSPIGVDAGAPVLVLVRPEDLRMEAGDGLVVEALSFHGHDTLYTLRDAQGREVLAREVSAPLHRIGETVSVTFRGRPAQAWARPDCSARETASHG